MRRFWPDFRTVDLETDNSPDIIALRDARQRLANLEARARADDDNSSKIVIACNKFGENEYAFRPCSLPLANRLPTIADMSNADCKHLRKSQRKFMLIVHRCNWVALHDEYLALDGEGEYREAIRFVSCSQPYAMSFLNAIPWSGDTTIPSDLMLVILQRQLGLPLTCVGGGKYSARLERFIDSYGDALANRKYAHQGRHHGVVNAWAKAWRAAFTGVEVPTEDSNYGDYSRGAKPDLVAYYAGLFRHHLIGEVKLVSPISTAKSASASDSKHKRAMRIGLGGTEQYQREKIMGRTFCANGGSKEMTAKYWYALKKGHSVVPLVHEVFGAWSDDCVEQLDRMGEIREGRLDKEFHDASWTERSFHNYYATRISTVQDPRSRNAYVVVESTTV